MNRPNLVVICIDCLRADFVGTDRIETPFLDRLSTNGLFYNTVISTANSTTPSVASLLTGTYSERNGVNSLREVELRSKVQPLAELLTGSGYDTYASVTGPLVTETGLDRGFDSYDHRDKEQELSGDWSQQLRDELDSSSKPFFLYLHLWELHKPITLTSGGELSGAAEYGRKLSELDHTLEQFVSALPDDTIIVLTGDHGESITWRGSALQFLMKRLREKLRFGRGWDTRPVEWVSNRLLSRVGPEIRDHFIENGHDQAVSDFVTQVPLVVQHQKLPSETVTAQCRQIDVFPTLLDMLDLSYDGALDGQSLLPPGDVDDRPAYIRGCGEQLKGKANWMRSIRFDEYKYIQYPNRPWSPELYDLEEDPDELTPITDPETKEELKSLLPSRNLRRSDTLDIEDHLEELGYL